MGDSYEIHTLHSGYFGFFLNVSTGDAMLHQIEYCELVELYESQEGIEYHKRDGHPNYNEVNCERIKASGKNK